MTEKNVDDLLAKCLRRTKYTTDGARFLQARITRIETERETEHFVWTGGRRMAKTQEFARVFDTWDEAHAFLLTQTEMKVIGARRQLELANSLLGNVKGMKKPEEAA